jgi:hypothetical protein
VYLYMERFGAWGTRVARRLRHPSARPVTAALPIS